MDESQKIKCVVIGAGPVGALAALYAARRGWDVEVYDLRGGEHLKYATEQSWSGLLADLFNHTRSS